MKKIVLCLLGISLMTHGVFAQSTASSPIVSAHVKDSLAGVLNTITTAVPFLLIAPDSRAGGMGDVGAATSPDVNSVHWNPSKLAFLEDHIGFSVSYIPWLRSLVNDISLAYLSGYLKLTDDQTIAVSLLYFSLGNITFTDTYGNTTGQFNPEEYAIDGTYARKLGDDFSAALTLRYINSNLTGGINVQGASSHAGSSAAADISAYYRHEIEVGGNKTMWSTGIDISNIGSKMTYTTAGNQDFIPTNFRLGTTFTSDLDEYNRLAFSLDVNKLLVPTPPVYLKSVAGGDSLDANGQQIIQAGKNPNVSVPQGMIQSWYDAPGGFAEEWAEFQWSAGLEYWYDKQFALRTGYFHEADTKGGRQFFTVGAGVKYNVFGLDFAYLIPAAQRNPLENTLTFTLIFNFAGLKGEEKDKDKDQSE